MSDRILRRDPPALPSRQTLPRLPQVELEIARGQARHRVRAVRPPVYLIGTASDCDLVLGDPSFPEVHTYLFVTEEGVSIRRLGADPVVNVSGRNVETAYLRDGDRLRLGPYEFVMHIRWPQPAPECDDIPTRLQQSYELPLRPSDAGSSPEQSVRQLLSDVRAEMGAAPPLLGLYVEPESPWCSVTSTQGLSIRRQSA